MKDLISMGKRTTICQNMEDRISIGKMNKTIPEYERSHIHGRSVQQYARIWKIVYPLEKLTRIYEDMKDRISMGKAYNNMPEYGRSYIHWKNEQDYTRI